MRRFLIASSIGCGFVGYQTYRYSKMFPSSTRDEHPTFKYKMMALLPNYLIYKVICTNLFTMDYTNLGLMVEAKPSLVQSIQDLSRSSFGRHTIFNNMLRKNLGLALKFPELLNYISGFDLKSNISKKRLIAQVIKNPELFNKFPELSELISSKELSSAANVSD